MEITSKQAALEEIEDRLTYLSFERHMVRSTVLFIQELDYKAGVRRRMKADSYPGAQKIFTWLEYQPDGYVLSVLPKDKKGILAESDLPRDMVLTTKAGKRIQSFREDGSNVGKYFFLLEDPATELICCELYFAAEEA